MSDYQCSENDNQAIKKLIVNTIVTKSHSKKTGILTHNSEQTMLKNVSQMPEPVFFSTQGWQDYES